MKHGDCIYCCGCEAFIKARLTDGKEIYPHRKDLYSLPFWKCDACGNKVGCHHKTKDRTKPLGVIPTPELMAARSHIHRILDPIWKQDKMKRGQIYSRLAKMLKKDEYHTANLTSVEDARNAYSAVKELRRELGM